MRSLTMNSQKIVMIESHLFDELAGCLQREKLDGQFKVVPYYPGILRYPESALQPDLIIFQDSGATDDGINDLQQKIDFAEGMRTEVKIVLARLFGLDEDYLQRQLKRQIDGILEMPFQARQVIDLVLNLFFYPIFEVADAVCDDGSKLNLFESLKSGTKSIDIRAFTPKYQAIQPYDIVIFRSLTTGEIIRRRIVFRKYASDFIEALNRLSELFGWAFVSQSIRHVFPGVETFQEAQNILYRWPGNQEKYERHGAVAFVLEEVKDESGKG